VSIHVADVPLFCQQLLAELKSYFRRQPPVPLGDVRANGMSRAVTAPRRRCSINISTGSTLVS